MSTTAAKAPLMNDVEFLGELERLEPVSEPAPDSDLSEGAFDALEVGLPIHPGARPHKVPHHERAPIDEPQATASEDPQPAEPRISFTASALVIILCLGAGAATAALVFHHHVSQISALRSANR